MEEEDNMTQGCRFQLFYFPDLNYFCSGCPLYLVPESHLQMKFICRMLEEQQNESALWKGFFWCQRPLDTALKWQRLHQLVLVHLFQTASVQRGYWSFRRFWCILYSAEESQEQKKRHCNSWFYLFFKNMPVSGCYHPFLWLLQAQHPVA